MARVSFVIGFVLIVHVFADVVVELDHGGLVRGSQVLSQSGKTYFSYTGIPYIEPPLNELRFKDPVPHNGWQGEFDATTQGPVCIQFDPIITSTYSGEEDCVVLNVYTPQNPEEAEKKLLPVMVWIHGGGFIVGTGQNELYNPSYLMDREIVLVSMNYRLNIFGFLSTEDSAASGNYGLKDQTEALKWVQKNIKRFGGDPSKVTIFGESAGGGSVHSQVLSSQAKGLFHAAIPQSGSVFMPWAMEESSLEHAKELAGAVGCPTSSTDSLVECLRGKPADELIHQMPKLYLKRGLVPLGFGPRVDKEAENPFFKAEPIDLMRSGDYNKVPMLTGAVKDEGLLFVLDEWFDRSEEQFRKADQEWMNSICVLLIDIEATVPKDQQMRVCQEIRDMYLGDLQINRDNFWNYQKMLGDRHFYYGLRIMYEEHSRHAPTFVYSIEHEPQFGFTNLVTTMNPTYPSDAPQPKGVCHADDILILFKIGSEITPGHPDFEVKEQMLDIWTSFATNKRPPIEQWPTWSLSQPYHWVIDRNPRLDVDLISNHLKHFWDTLGINENQSKLAPGSSKDEL